MQLDAITGQDRVVDALRRSIAANRVAHAYLFEGISGCGRRSTALALIKSLFCAQPVNGDSCGSCPGCRKVEKGNHPDIQFLQPLPDKRDISIEQVRELQQALSLRPYEAGRKACLIEPAERMSTGAANALLKTLEEPPGHALMILLTNQADLLLSTVRSRCQHIRFSPLDEEALATLLIRSGIPAGKAADLAALAEGSIEQANLLDTGDAEAIRRELMDVLQQTAVNRIASVFDASERLAGNRDETLALFTLLIALLRDMALLRSTGAAARIANVFLRAELTSEASRFTPEALLEALDVAVETRRAIQGNVNAKLGLDHFLLRYGSLRTA